MLEVEGGGIFEPSGNLSRVAMPMNDWRAAGSITRASGVMALLLLVPRMRSLSSVECMRGIMRTLVRSAWVAVMKPA